MRHATALLYHVCAVASRNITFASCGTSGKLTLWTRYYVLQEGKQRCSRPRTDTSARVLWIKCSYKSSSASLCTNVSSHRVKAGSVSRSELFALPLQKTGILCASGTVYFVQVVFFISYVDLSEYKSGLAHSLAAYFFAAFGAREKSTDPIAKKSLSAISGSVG
jgi:hypothetical protein